VVVDGQGIPLGSTLTSTSPAEVTLAEETLETVKVPPNGRGRPKKRPLRLIADKGYDSDPLRKRLKVYKIDLIVPHRNNRKKPKLQNGRKLRFTESVGKLNEPSRGWVIIAACLQGMSEELICIVSFFSLPVL
jgi:hypothetical protein